jgi:hypothetical protein
MPCTVRDASSVTIKNRNMALNSYYNSWKEASVLSSNANLALKSPGITGAEVVAEIKLGCAACHAVSNEAAKNGGQPYDPNVSRYPFNPSAGGASGLTGQSS